MQSRLHTGIINLITLHDEAHGNEDQYGQRYSFDNLARKMRTFHYSTSQYCIFRYSYTGYISISHCQSPTLCNEKGASIWQNRYAGNRKLIKMAQTVASGSLLRPDHLSVVRDADLSMRPECVSSACFQMYAGYVPSPGASSRCNNAARSPRAALEEDFQSRASGPSRAPGVPYGHRPGWQENLFPGRKAPGA